MEKNFKRRHRRAFEIAAPIFHFGAFVHFMVGISLHFHFGAKEQNHFSKFGYGLKYFTVWSAMVQIVYYLGALMAGIVILKLKGVNINLNYSNYLLKWLSILGFLRMSLAFPTALFTCISYWILKQMDLEMLFATNDNIFPIYFSHMINTNILILQVLDHLVLELKSFPLVYSILGVVVFYILYLVWVLIIRYSTGIWPFPFLGRLTYVQLIITYALVFVFLLLALWIGKKLNDFLWNEEISAKSFIATIFLKKPMSVFSKVKMSKGENGKKGIYKTKSEIHGLQCIVQTSRNFWDWFMMKLGRRRRTKRIPKFRSKTHDMPPELLAPYVPIAPAKIDNPSDEDDLMDSLKIKKKDPQGDKSSTMTLQDVLDDKKRAIPDLKTWSELSFDPRTPPNLQLNKDKSSESKTNIDSAHKSEKSTVIEKEPESGEQISEQQSQVPQHASEKSSDLQSTQTFPVDVKSSELKDSEEQSQEPQQASPASAIPLTQQSTDQHTLPEPPDRPSAQPSSSNFQPGQRPEQADPPDHQQERDNEEPSNSTEQTNKETKSS